MAREVKVTGIYMAVNRWDLPDGQYDGLWSGYTIRVNIGPEHYVLHTDIGIRGLNKPCVVKVEKGEITIE